MATKCEEEGCDKEATVECKLIGSEQPDEHLCAKHAQEAGYCPGCGWFCSGTESFDFGPHKGWCETCWAQIVADTGDDEEPDEWAEFDWEADGP